MDLIGVWGVVVLGLGLHVGKMSFMMTARSRFVSVKVEEKKTLSLKVGGCHKLCKVRGGLVMKRSEPQALAAMLSGRALPRSLTQRRRWAMGDKMSGLPERCCW